VSRSIEKKVVAHDVYRDREPGTGRTVMDCRYPMLRESLWHAVCSSIFEHSL
jgi:hypothetical protein